MYPSILAKHPRELDHTTFDTLRDWRVYRRRWAEELDDILILATSSGDGSITVTAIYQ